MSKMTAIAASKRKTARCLTLVLLAISQQSSHAWISSAQAARFAATTRSRTTVLSSGVDSVSLANVDNHQEEGEKMAKSIASWLDAEWMPQEVHVKMAQSAKQSYIACREAGDHDLMSIMTTIADDLTASWSEYDADAFINAWDISNYVSDYLVQLSSSGNNESCDCSAKIH